MRASCFIAIVLLFVLQLSCSPARKTLPSITTLSQEDEQMFTEVQRRTFQYFWDGAEPVSGLARERFHVDNVYPQNDKMVDHIFVNFFNRETLI